MFIQLLSALHQYRISVLYEHVMKFTQSNMNGYVIQLCTQVFTTYFGLIVRYIINILFLSNIIIQIYLS